VRLSAASIKFAAESRSHNQVNWRFLDNHVTLCIETLEENDMSIMVAYDGSEVAKESLELAKVHARAFKEDLEVVQAAENGDDLEYSKVRQLELNLESEIKNLMGNDDIPYKTTLLVSSGTPGEEIVRHQKVRECREIFMGVRRRSKVGKLLFGSTAQYVILNAPCPVVTTR
jgi:nucleotide-binding universal stress UspA family protein